MKQIPKVCALLGIALLLSTPLVWAQSNDGASTSSVSPNAQGPRPNILFIIMDDVGIDQMSAFGYGGLTPPQTPNINAIATAGVRFRNTWAMPECSPSRAIFFEGRFPLRTNVLNAITSNDLANSQVSPFEATLPKVLRDAGYKSALFGKFHLGGPQNNPFRNATPLTLGWDYFYGFLEGAPHPIDTTAGLSDPSSGTPGPYPCGFVPNSSGTAGADTGACYTANNSCTNLSATPDQPIPGLSCLVSGGIFVPSQSCQATPPTLYFSTLNAYYVSPLFIEKRPNSVEAVDPMDSRSRTYRSILETDAAISWINGQAPNQSWMATLAFSAIHSPYQPPPASLLPAGSADPNKFDCTGNHLSGLIYERILSDQMLEAMDKEIGRLMVETGLATANSDGSLNYQPEKTNTMVVIIGDNGTYAPGVKAPFDPSRSKAYVYQTGVWVPLIIAGPIVKSPNRNVESQINVADLFQLFGAIGGVDVRKVVPSSHILDSLPMLGYLTNPNQESIRKENFTQSAYNLTPKGILNQPCVVVVAGAPICTQIVPNAATCTIEGGDWWGAGSPFQECDTCCQVQASPLYPYSQPLTFYPDFQAAMRDDNFKVVQIRRLDGCANPAQPKESISNEFYQIDQGTPPKIDLQVFNLCVVAPGCPAGLPPDQAQIYNKLFADMQAELKSEPACPGDGNLDKVVNSRDIDLWKFFATISQGDGTSQTSQPLSSSWYDLNRDGLTNFEDLLIILRHLGDRCVPLEEDSHSASNGRDDGGR
ncbi:MAG TPA: sulfatase-like hydrolase/transferase [Terriglobales bacterium]